MAHIDSPIRNHKVNTRSNSRSTRVDLTPMVDLGFLLLTFFVFVTNLSESKVMDMVQHKDSDISDKICESCVLTVLAGPDNDLYFSEGNSDTATYYKTSYSSEGLRQILVSKKNAVIKKRGRNDFVMIMKASERSNFKNLVDLADEASISGVARYYMEELTLKDKAFIGENR